MLVNGADCFIVIKTAYREVGVPYSDETIREAVSILHEEAAIEGDGARRMQINYIYCYHFMPH
jgi:cbb3-type cytochrome oxidase cytochrome c subunit